MVTMLACIQTAAPPNVVSLDVEGGDAAASANYITNFLVGKKCVYTASIRPSSE